MFKGNNKLISELAKTGAKLRKANIKTIQDQTAFISKSSDEDLKKYLRYGLLAVINYSKSSQLVPDLYRKFSCLDKMSDKDKENVFVDHYDNLNLITFAIQVSHYINI